MKIEKNRDGIVGAVETILDRARKSLDEQRDKLAEAMDKDTIRHWLEWNALSLARAKMRAGEWEGIYNGVRRMFDDEGKTPDEVLGELRKYRDSIVERVLGADQSNKSTSVMGNALKDEDMQVLRSVAGVNILSCNSLASILAACDAM